MESDCFDATVFFWPTLTLADTVLISAELCVSALLMALLFPSFVRPDVAGSVLKSIEVSDGIPGEDPEI